MGDYGNDDLNTILNENSALWKDDTLRDIAVRKCGRNVNKPFQRQHLEHTILFLGSKGVGKTTLIHRFLDRNETARQTLALDYTYGRKSGRSPVKDVCHIWELGGGTHLAPLLDAPLASLGLEGLHHLTVILMLDLSTPNHLWFTLETLIKCLLASIHRLAGSELSKLMDEAWNRVGVDNPDKEFLDPFPVDLVIIGGMYDEFQNTEPGKKKAVCRGLRYVAHTLGASLLFYSMKEPGLVKKSKDLLNHHAFGTPAMKSISQDYNKPLIVPAGFDTMEQISGVGSISMPPRKKQHGPGSALAFWKHTFTTYFPQETSERNIMPEDPGKDRNFAEPVIDELRVQKDDELELYRQESERRQKVCPSNIFSTEI